ncbi:hypothetical protein ACSSS7_003443 [Eimeria intestinalis]
MVEQNPGWNTARKRLREVPLDEPADEGMQSRLVGSEYFDPLRAALRNFLEELKRLSLEDQLQIEQPRPLRFNNRQTEYDASREATTKIDPKSIYCVESLTNISPNPASIKEHQMPNVRLVDPEKYRQQSKKRSSPHIPSATTATLITTSRPLVADSSITKFTLGSLLSYWTP